MGIQMDLDFSLLETGSLAFSIIVTAFALQVLNLLTLYQCV
jgi:Ca2+:H+ antiporter